MNIACNLEDEIIPLQYNNQNNLSQDQINKYRVVTGERPTGPLHIGHLFGTINKRLQIQQMGVEIFIVIADYQVLTDSNIINNLGNNVKEVMLDYLACGLDPLNKRTFFFIHSHIPELNQLLLPFMSLISISELSRNPTIKSEIQTAGLTSVNSLMYTYPIHQAADILSCQGNLVPVGRDQLPHLELTRKIARRFNDRFTTPDDPIFPMPKALLSDMSIVLGTDGQKMSKSRHNHILLKMTSDETAKMIKITKTDSIRNIYFDPDNRPEVSNLIKILNICTGEDIVTITDRIGNNGAGRLKNEVTEALNSYLEPIRNRRIQIENDTSYITTILKQGTDHIRNISTNTLKTVLNAMNMNYGFKL